MNPEDRADLPLPSCPAGPSCQLAAKPASPASRPAVGTAQLGQLPRLRGSSDGNWRGRGSPARLSASPHRGARGTGLRPLCQNQPELQPLLCTLTTKSPQGHQPSPPFWGADMLYLEEQGKGASPPAMSLPEAPALWTLSAQWQGRGASPGPLGSALRAWSEVPALKVPPFPAASPPPRSSQWPSGRTASWGGAAPLLTSSTARGCLGRAGALGRSPGRRPPEQWRLWAVPAESGVQATASLCYFESADLGWPEHKGDFTGCALASPVFSSPPCGLDGPGMGTASGRLSLGSLSSGRGSEGAGAMAVPRAPPECEEGPPLLGSSALPPPALLAFTEPWGPSAEL